MQTSPAEGLKLEKQNTGLYRLNTRLEGNNGNMLPGETEVVGSWLRGVAAW